MDQRQADQNLVIRVLFMLLVLFGAILVLLCVIPVIFWLIDLTMLNHPKVCYFSVIRAIQCYSVLFSAIQCYSVLFMLFIRQVIQIPSSYLAKAGISTS